MFAIPVFESDPFLWLSPTITTDSLWWNHWHEVLFMFTFYCVLQAWSPTISKKLFGRHYTDLDNKGRINFDIHVVSMIQCFISLISLAPMWNHPFFQNRIDNAHDSILGKTEYGGLVASCAVGYFLWDVYVCARYFESFGFGFLFHGVSAFYVFGCTLIPFCMPWIPAFLIFELSTPFVNINWFASRLPVGVIPNKVVIINGLCLMITFFMVRIVWGFYAVILVAIDLYKTLGEIHIMFPIILLLINGSLDFLNVFWFYKMVRIARKKLQPKQFAKQTDMVE